MNNISRRDFLKLGGAMLGVMALPEGVWALGEKPPWYREDVTVGNLKLTPIITEHHQEDWLEVKDEVLAELNKFPTIVCEYLPFEYKNPENGKILEKVSPTYDELNFAFLEIEDWALQNNKPIVVVDPAYSMDSVKLRVNSKLPTAVVGAVVAEAGAVGMAKVASTMESKLDRIGGTVMAGVAGGILIPTIDAMFLGGDGGEEEVDVRHVFTARALVKLGDDVLPGTQMAIVYPPAHWDGSQQPMALTELKKGILHYLENPDELAEKVKLYEEKYPKSDYPDFYKIRGYSPENGSWEKTREMSVN